MQVEIIPFFQDNYCYCIIDKKSYECALVDPAQPSKVVPSFEKINQERFGNKLSLTYILTTHHHRDHAGGNEEMKQHFPSVNVIGSKYEDIPARTKSVEHDEEFQLTQNLRVRVLYTPCHTKGHVQYLVSDSQNSKINKGNLFTGDTFFVAGAGKFFEGDAKQMLQNVRLIQTLDPQNTFMYCGHEYTVSNLKYALSVEPENQHVKDKLSQSESLRQQDKPTVPTTLADEFLYNPFMRIDQPSIQRWAESDDPEKVMHIVRERKDNFRA